MYRSNSEETQILYNSGEKNILIRSLSIDFKVGRTIEYQTFPFGGRMWMSLVTKTEVQREALSLVTSRKRNNKDCTYSCVSKFFSQRSGC